jgi:hypothetical protein
MPRSRSPGPSSSSENRTNSRATPTRDGRERERRERVCRSMLRPAFSHAAVERTADGHVRVHGEAALLQGEALRHERAHEQRQYASPTPAPLQPHANLSLAKVLADRPAAGRLRESRGRCQRELEGGVSERGKAAPRGDPTGRYAATETAPSDRSRHDLLDSSLDSSVLQLSHDRRTASGNR